MCPPPASGAVSIGEVPPAAEAALVEAMGADDDLVAARFARGCRAFAARREGKLVAYG